MSSMIKKIETCLPASNNEMCSFSKICATRVVSNDRQASATKTIKKNSNDHITIVFAGPNRSNLKPRKQVGSLLTTRVTHWAQLWSRPTSSPPKTSTFFIFIFKTKNKISKIYVE